MKKYILLVVCAVALAFTSCTDSEEVAISYNHDFSVSIKTADLYNEVGITDFQKLLGGNPSLYTGFTILLYNEQGELCKQVELHTNDMQPLSYTFDDIVDGKYTIITIQHIVNSALGYNSEVWSLEDINNIDKLKIVNVSKNDILWYDCLGIDTQVINIAENATAIIAPKVAGSFVHFEAENFDKSVYNYIAFYFKDAANGIFLNPKLSASDRYYYKNGFNESNKWSTIASFYYQAGLPESKGKTVFILDSGVKNICFGPSIVGEDGKVSFYRYHDTFFEFGTGEEYKAYCHYNEKTDIITTYFNTLENYNLWKKGQQGELGMIFEHPCTIWGASVSNVKSLMNEGGYTIYQDIEESDNLFSLTYNGKYKELLTQYFFETKSSNLLFSSIFILKKNASLEEVIGVVENDYILYEYNEEYNYYTYYNEDTILEVAEGYLDDGTEYINLFYGELSVTRANGNLKAQIEDLHNACKSLLKK